MKTKEEILDSHYEPNMHWKTVNRHSVLLAMDVYNKPSLDRIRDLESELEIQKKKVELNYNEVIRLEKLINNPELNNFIEGFKVEAAHQIERWTEKLEEQKPPHHYIMVFAKLLGKLTVSIWDYDKDKFKHHCITICASLYNCHRQIEKPNTEVNKWFYVYSKKN